MRRIVSMVKRHQPKEIHVAIFSPPVSHPCFYGIDMPSKDELIASNVDPAELSQRLADHLGADSMTYLSPVGLNAVAGTSVCDACFTGNYVVPVTTNERDWILAQRRA